MSNQAVNFEFKLVYSSQSWVFRIRRILTVNQFINEVVNTQEFRSLVDINSFYHIDVVASGNNINGDAELAPPISGTSEKFIDVFNPRYTSFYIRPVHPITREFIRKNTYHFRPDETEFYGPLAQGTSATSINIPQE